MPPADASTESGEVTCTGPLDTATTAPSFDPTAFVIEIPRALASTIASANNFGRRSERFET